MVPSAIINNTNKPGQLKVLINLIVRLISNRARELLRTGLEQLSTWFFDVRTCDPIGMDCWFLIRGRGMINLFLAA